MGYPAVHSAEKTRLTMAYPARHGGWTKGLTGDPVRCKIRLFIEMSRDVPRERAALGFPVVDAGHSFEQVIACALRDLSGEERDA